LTIETVQPSLWQDEPSARTSKRANGATANKLLPEDRVAHDWYRFVLSYPPHLVRDYIQRFGLNQSHVLLDPFCGTGTTLVEAKRCGIPSVGVEANPLAHFASEVKTDWRPSPAEMLEHAIAIAEAAQDELRAQGLADDTLLLSGSNGIHTRRGLSPEKQSLILTDSISPIPLHKVLVLLDIIDQQRDDRFYNHERLALAKAIVYTISNLTFGPEVGVGPAKGDVAVVAAWFDEVRKISRDLTELQKLADVPATVHHADSRQLLSVLEPHTIDAVITSPPYPNEKDYTRTTRLESVLLGFIQTKQELRAIKKTLVRSNTRSVYTTDEDDHWVDQFPEIQRIADAIEARRIELGKTSGFERLYARVTKLYFGGMARHLADLRTILRPGAQLAYVVGDQASYLRVMIRTGQILGDIASSLGYELVGIDLFRTRLATATKEQLREEVVVLRWPS
jgi:hypothetical protein